MEIHFKVRSCSKRHCYFWILYFENGGRALSDAEPLGHKQVYCKDTLENFPLVTGFLALVFKMLHMLEQNHFLKKT